MKSRICLVTLLLSLYSISRLNAQASNDRPNVAQGDQAKSLPAIIPYNDYLIPVLIMADAAFNLQHNWVAPATNGGITQVGAWISPNQAGFTILASIFFTANSAALNKNYQTKLKELLTLSHRDLKPNTGWLFKASYDAHDDLGGVDPTSARFSSIGTGLSPEQALAAQRMGGWEAGHRVSAVYPNVHSHYVWIEKSDQGDLKVSTIQEQFVPWFENHAFALKEGLLKTPVAVPVIKDLNLKQLDLYSIWDQHCRRFANELAERKALNEVNQLKDDFKKVQSAYNDLYVKHQAAIAESRENQTALLFLDLCQTLTDVLNKNYPNHQSSEKGQLQFQKQYLQGQLNEVNKWGVGVNDYNFRLKKIFDKARLPQPALKLIPLL